MSYVGKTIREVQEGLRKGVITRSGILDDAKARSSVVERLNAFTSFLCSEDKHVEGRLSGVPVGLKDNFCVKGSPTTCASETLRNFIAPYDATVVSKIKKAGGVIFGKTNMDEFAMGSGTVDSIFGPVFNIWHSEAIDYQVDGKLNTIKKNRIAGGSSGGSAVSVATGVCLLALGSDTGGSIRIPAAYCGIPSLKPSYGMLSRHGLIPLVNSLDVPGMFASNFDDLNLFFNVLKGRDPLDSTTVEYGSSDYFETKKFKIGIPLEYRCEGMSDDVLSAWSYIANKLDDDGFQVDSVSLPHSPYSLSCYLVLMSAEVASNMARYDGLEYGLRSHVMDSVEKLFEKNRTCGFSDVVMDRILVGNYFILREKSAEYFEKALKIRRLIYDDFIKVFSEGYDVLVTPVTPTVAPLYEDFIQKNNQSQCVASDFCTQPVSIAGLPAVTLPVKLSSEGLPLSVQLIGRPFEDEKILQLGKYMESMLGFPKLKIVEP